MRCSSQGLQQSLVAVQTALPGKQASEGIAIIIFTQTLGAAIFLSIAQSVFENQLLGNIQAGGIPVNPKALLSAGATSLSLRVPSQYLEQLRVAYNAAVVQVCQPLWKQYCRFSGR